MTSSTAPTPPAPWRRPRVLVAAVVALAVLAATAIAVWQLDQGSSGNTAATSTAVSTSDGVEAEIVSPEQLRDIARTLGRPVYWAGTRAGTRIEYTQTADGSTYVRYLTGSAEPGVDRSDFVVVATYAQPNAFERVQSIARKKHFEVERLPNGAVAITQQDSPHNVHLVFPAQPYQIEVYAPRAAQARRIARSGAVTPVG
jgi:hypothetical protein